MQLILAEFCGRWGCTWQEGLINVLLVSLGSKRTLILLCILLGILLLPIFFGVLILLIGLETVYEFISGWGRALLDIPKPHKSPQQSKRILPTVEFLDRTLIVANKTITDYRQDQDVKHQTNSQQQDTQEQDETVVNSVSNEAVNNSGESQPQRKRNLAAAKFLGRTLRNLAKD